MLKMSLSKIHISFSALRTGQTTNFDILWFSLSFSSKYFLFFLVISSFIHRLFRFCLIPKPLRFPTFVTIVYF